MVPQTGAARSLAYDDAVEVVLVVFAQSWERAKTGAPAHELPLWYFYKAVDYQVARAIRDKEYSRVAADMHYAEVALPRSQSESAEYQMERAEFLRVAADAVAGLPDRCRQSWTLVKEHELSYMQAAQVLEITPGAVKKNLIRASEMLRQRVLAAGYDMTAFARLLQAPAQSLLQPGAEPEAMGDESAGEGDR